MSGEGFSVSIPSSMKKMIENIKEIAENHSDEEIYAMLEECSMDPDETIQKLLIQDPFHEVKSKRERRKENVNTKESVDSRTKATNLGRGGRGGSSNIAHRYASNDIGSGRNSISGKDNGVNQVVEKRLFHDTKNKERSRVKRALPIIDVGPTSLRSENPTKINSFFVGNNNKGTAMPPTAATKKPTSSSKKYSSELDSGSQSVSTTSVTSSVAYFSSSNSILVSSKYSEFLDATSSTKCDNGTEQFSSEPSTVSPAVNTSIAETLENIKTLTEGNLPSKSQGLGGNQINEFCQSSTSANGESAISWPSSTNVNPPQQIIGSQKVGFNKEWKPKTKNSLGVQGPETLNKVTSCESETGAGTGNFAAIAHSQPVAEVHVSKEITKLEEKLENLHLPPTHLVILPDHIHVPDYERNKLSFGSFGVGFDLNTNYGGFPGSDKSPTAVSGSETSLDIEETSDKRTLSDQNALETAKEGDYDDHSQSPIHATESLSGEVDISSNVIQANNDMKQQVMKLTAGSPQYSVVHPLQDYGFGIAPPLSGSHLSPFEISDSQARDVSRLPGFVVHQSFDPTGYYSQYYRSGADSDGRISPVPNTGVTTKYNGNVATVTQSPQEGGVLSTAGRTNLGTQATGQMQSSVAVTEPSVTVFRPPTGMHISHFPPNYIPYGHYFSPFYVPQPIHQLLGNNAFPHQPQSGSVYPTLPAAAAAVAVKYSLPQYKVGTNSGNSTQLGIPTGYGPYGSTPSGYNPNSDATGGIAAGNEDISVTASIKENNVYITGPQSEGSAVWVAAPGREISNLAGNSFYNLPPQGPHVTFTPTQGGHGTFASIYHPAQAAATMHPHLQQSQAVAGGADIVGPGGNVYQQSQHSQTNWPINY